LYQLLKLFESNCVTQGNNIPSLSSIMQSVGVLLWVPREFPSEQPSCAGVAPHHDSDFPFGTKVDYRDDKTW